MPVNPTSITKLDDGQWRYVWTGTAPYRLYSDGQFLNGQSTNDTSIVLQSRRNTYVEQRNWTNVSATLGTALDTDEPPPLEILDANDTDDPQNILYPPRMRIQWRGNTQADYYIVERQVNSVWETVVPVRESGQGYYVYTTDVLDDGTQYNYRVISVGADDTEGTPITYSATVVRNPAPPRISLSYDSGTTTITASARA